MKEWREVTIIKEWVKSLYIGYLQVLDLPQNLSYSIPISAMALNSAQ